jgi:hypothetical protein
MGEQSRQAGTSFTIISRAISAPIPCTLKIEVDAFGAIGDVMLWHSTVYDGATVFALERALYWLKERLRMAWRNSELAIDVMGRMFPEPADPAADIAMIERSLLREVVAVQALRNASLFGGAAHG